MRRRPAAQAVLACPRAEASSAAPAMVDEAYPQNRLQPYHAGIILLAGFLVRLWLIHAYPLIFGGDSILRLFFHDRVLLAYQLPLLQAGIHCVSLLSEDPVWVRWLMAGIGSAAGLGFYSMTSTLFGREGAFYASLFFVTNPFILAFSIVPYQEILMLAGLFFAFSFFFQERWLAASLCLGIACLTRYEAWAASAVLGAAFALRGKLRPAAFAKAAALFGWAPLAWMAFHFGLSPPGSYVLDFNVSFDRLWRYAYLGWITFKNTPPPVLLLAAWGFWRFGKQGLLRSPRYLVLTAFVLIFLAAVLFSAHGVREDPDRWVTAREAHIPLAAVIVLAGLGFQGLRRWRGAALALCLGAGLFMADRFVARETSEPRLQLSYRLAQLLDESVSEGEHAVILAPPIPQPALDLYLDQAEEKGGPRGRRKAIELLADLNPSPPDFQRAVVHSRLGRDRMHSLSTLPLPPKDAEAFAQERAERAPSPLPALTPDWVAVWSDFEPANPAEARLAESVEGKEPEETLEEGGLSICVYKIK